ncbi:acetylxylan esterase [Kineococcus arenarius]|uniref:acetylxylan esterase n=1 Tax=unclassified Kineococcus TaxID=2621656 RepID=UPI003D7D7080
MPPTDLPLEQLRDHLGDVAEPADFDAFWAGSLAEARRHRLDPVLREGPGPELSEVEVADVRFSGWGGDRIAGWFPRPRRTQGPLPVVVKFIGYSGTPGRAVEHTEWAAAALPGVDPARLVVAGGSQGGSFALAAAHLAGEAVEQTFHTLSCVDGANHALRASAPALFSVGAMDPVCPPSTVFAAYDRYGARAGRPVRKDITVWEFPDHSGGAAHQFERQLRFLDELRRQRP